MLATGRHVVGRGSLANSVRLLAVNAELVGKFPFAAVIDCNHRCAAAIDCDRIVIVSSHPILIGFYRILIASNQILISFNRILIKLDSNRRKSSNANRI